MRTNRRLRTDLSEIFQNAQSLNDWFCSVNELIRNPERNLSYSTIAKAAGFKSRSYVRALFVGDKSPSLPGLEKIGAAFGIRDTLMEGLRCLYFLEREDDGARRKNLEKKLLRLRAQIDKNLRKTTQQTGRKDYLKIPEWPIVFSALSGSEPFLSVAQVSAKTRISEERCQRILDYLVEVELADYDSAGRGYRNAVDVVDFSQMGGVKAFAAFYQRLLKDEEVVVNERFGDPFTLFHVGVFSIDRRDLPELTQKLQKLLAEFTSEHENSTGDSIVKMRSSLYI